MIPVYHVRGRRACLGIAIYVKTAHPFADAAGFPADNVITVTGTTPLRGSPPVCGSCGCVIDSFAELSYDRVNDPAADLRRPVIETVKV